MMSTTHEMNLGHRVDKSICWKHAAVAKELVIVRDGEEKVRVPHYALHPSRSLINAVSPAWVGDRAVGEEVG